MFNARESRAKWYLFVLIGALCMQDGGFSQSSNQAPPTPEDGRNRLGDEASPYLLQHEKNPVHWYPWGEEAFEAARSQKKPIFLSIGYSTCYWCHVMERESFEDQEVADVLNEHFIAIKVDREERPDVDEIYMTAVQMITRGRGGWPLSVFMEPNDLQPFFGGTYFPKNSSGGQRGFIPTLEFVNEKWQNENEAVMKQAQLVSNAVKSRLTTEQEPVQLNSKVVERGVSGLLSRYDADQGGFSTAPKFPMPVYSDFLLNAGWDIPQVRKSVTHTLDEMLMGGMYDQVGGGFHRYSTDGLWLVPHFEKMLYDNGQLVSTYALAYEKTGDPRYAKVIEETLDYVERELSSPDGGFLSAQDAESNHLEGESYLWREHEIEEVLRNAGRENDLAFVLSVYGVDKGTNFRDPHHPEVPPTNVLYLTAHPEQLAVKHGMTYVEFQKKLDGINELLLSVRDTRDQPSTDDKVITAWNGVMIKGFADAGRILDNPQWIARAEKAADFIVREMQTNEGALLRTWRQGTRGPEAFLIDYSALIHGLLAIHRANNSEKSLNQAIELYDKAKSLFYVKGEGWYDTREGQSDLFVRTRAQSDGAMPAGTSLILLDQIELASRTNDARFLEDALVTLNSESQLLSAAPLAAVVATQGLHTLLERYPEKFDEEFEVTLSNPSPVRLSCEFETDSVKSGVPIVLNVKLRMAKGWHVNSNSPGNEYAIPLSFASYDEGVSVSAEWPEGELMVSAGEQVHVYGESVVVPVTLTTTESFKGPIALMVTWQACNADTCLNPETHRVPCTIVVE